jgi:hypothetical protein
MKVRPVSIDKTNAFAEAAGGGAMGQPNGASGSKAIASSTEWERAVESVAEDRGHPGGKKQPSIGAAADSRPRSGPQGGAELAATVALGASHSMHARNAKGLIGVARGGPLAGLAPDAATMVAWGMLQADTQRQAETTALDLSASAQAATDLKKSVYVRAQVEASFAPIEVSAGNDAFREGTKDALVQMGNHRSSAESGAAGSRDAALLRAGTTTVLIADPTKTPPEGLYAPEQLSSLEIPVESTAVHWAALDARSSEGSRAQTTRTQPAPARFQPGLAGSARLGATAPGPLSAQSGMSATAGPLVDPTPIAVTAALDSALTPGTLAGRATAAAAAPSALTVTPSHEPMVTDVSNRAQAMASPIDLAKQAPILQQNPTPVPLQTQHGRGTPQPSLPSEAPSESPFTMASSTPVSLAASMGDGPLDAPFQNLTAKLLDQGAAKMLGSSPLEGGDAAAAPQSGLGEVQGVVVSGGTQVVTAIEREGGIQNSIVDAETITADEMPELPLQDLSQIDIDIDDPMGRVRLDMVREAQEVAIRLETPAEVLEEYREMEGELDEALAKSGMTLSDFEARSGDDPDAQAKDSNGERRDAESEAGAKPLESHGDRGRLLNRVV